MLKKLTPVFVLLMTCILGAVAQANTLELMAERDGVVEYRLDNGLRVIFAEDPSASAIFFNMVYLTGSLADPESKSGTAHLLEHLMFKGTEHRSGQQLISGLRQRGIQFNATTSYDRTRYSAAFDADPAKLEYMVELEAERMLGLAFDQAALEGEVDVVLREMELAQDDSLAALGQQMLAAATPGRGYGRPALGEREELGNITGADLTRFHTTYYQPHNAVILIAGKFDAKRALAAVQRHFSSLTSSVSADGKEQGPTPMPDKPVTVSVTQGEIDMVTLGYPLPPANDERNVALMVLADIFAGEPHGRLYQALVVPGHALGVLALQQNFKQGGYFMFSVPLAQGQSREQAQAVLIKHVESLARQRIGEAELQRAKVASRHMKERILRDPGMLSHILSESVALGNWQLLLQRYDQLAELDIQSVQQQAEGHFVSQRRLLGKLHAGGQSAGSAPAAPHTAKAAGSLDSAVEVEAPLMVDVAAFNQHIMAVENSVQRSRLDHGLKLALRPLPGDAGPVQGIMTLRFGDAHSLFGKGAVAELAGTMLLRGSESFSHQEIVDRANQLGAGLSVMPSGSVLTVRFESPAENLSALLDLVAEVLRRPTFPLSEFELVKRQRLLSLTRADQRPASVAGLQLRRYGEDFPVGDIRRHTEHDEMRAAVKKVDRKDVLYFHTHFYGADQGEFALAGNFDPQQVREQLAVLFGDWRSQRPNNRTSKPYKDVKPARMHIRANAAQTGYYIGRLNFAANSKTEDAAALFIAEHILGRHPVASRLGKRLREEENLTYQIRSSIKLATFDDASWVSIQGSYPRGQGARLADIVREEVTRLAKSGISQQELELARNTILNERRLSFSQDRNILSWLPRQLYEGSTMQSWVERNDAFAAVNLEQVNAVMRRYWDAEKMVEILADMDGQEVQLHETARVGSR